MSSPRRNYAEPRHRLTKEQAVREFYDVLLPDPDPASMQIAQDLCEDYGLKLADLGEAMAKVGFENKRWADAKGWANEDPSAGQFTITPGVAPFRVFMRRPKRGERGWWVNAKTSEAALQEILTESDFSEGAGDVGWLAVIDYTHAKPDEYGMVPVTVEVDPGYRSVWWSVWHGSKPVRKAKGGLRTFHPDGFRIGLGCSYGGAMWDESKKGARFTGLGGVIDEDRKLSIVALPPILDKTSFRQLKDARAAAAGIAWKIAKDMKQYAASGSDAVDLLTALHERYAGAAMPPKAIVNPPTGVEDVIQVAMDIAEEKRPGWFDKVNRVLAQVGALYLVGDRHLGQSPTASIAVAQCIRPITKNYQGRELPEDAIQQHLYRIWGETRLTRGPYIIVSRSTRSVASGEVAMFKADRDSESVGENEWSITLDDDSLPMGQSDEAEFRGITINRALSEVGVTHIVPCGAVAMNPARRRTA